MIFARRPSALIVGAGGQDGTFLTRRLALEHTVIGVTRTTVTSTDGVADLPARVDVTNKDDVRTLMAAVRPDQIYYLAAHHQSSESIGKDPTADEKHARDVNVTGLRHFLEAMRAENTTARLFYAGSSHMFGTPSRWPQDESTPFAPETVYARTKVEGARACAEFRHRHGLFASVGLLYNHESALRPEGFLSRRLVRGAIAAARGLVSFVRVGSLSHVGDFGHAEDTVDAIARILSLDRADDFVVATGEAHTVAEFAEAAFAAKNLDYRRHVKEDPSLVPRQATPRVLVGDATKLRERTGWAPRVRFVRMVERLVRETEDIT